MAKKATEKSATDTTSVKPASKTQPTGVVKQEIRAVSSIEQIITNAANKYGIDPNYALRIARCESSLNPNSVNYNYAEIAGHHPSGLYQHLSNYWPARAAKYGYAGASVFDATANANVTMAMWRDGGINLWECK